MVVSIYRAELHGVVVRSVIITFVFSSRRRHTRCALVTGVQTCALPIMAGEWARRGKRVVLVDADPQGSALDWSQQRAREGLARLFGVVGLAREIGRASCRERVCQYV